MEKSLPNPEEESLYAPLEKRLPEQTNLPVTLLMALLSYWLAFEGADLAAVRQQTRTSVCKITGTFHSWFETPLDQLRQIRKADQKALDELKTELREDLKSFVIPSFEDFRFSGEQAGMGMTPSEAAEAREVLNNDVNSLLPLKPAYPTREFLAKLDALADNSGENFSALRSSAIRFAIRKSRGQDHRGTCDAKSAYTAMLLERLYPEERDNIFFQGFGVHRRTLFYLREAEQMLSIEPGIPLVTKEDSSGTIVYGIREYIASFIGRDMKPVLTVLGQEEAEQEQQTGNPLYAPAPPHLETDSAFPSPSVKGPLRLYNPDVSALVDKAKEEQATLKQELAQEAEEVAKRKGVTILVENDLPTQNPSRNLLELFNLGRYYSIEFLLLQLKLNIDAPTAKDLRQIKDYLKSTGSFNCCLSYILDHSTNYQFDAYKEMWNNPPETFRIETFGDAFPPAFLSAYKNRKSNPFALSLPTEDPIKEEEKQLFLENLGGIHFLEINDVTPADLDKIAAAKTRYVQLGFLGATLSEELVDALLAHKDTIYFMQFKYLALYPELLDSENVAASDIFPDLKKVRSSFPSLDTENYLRWEKIMTAYFGFEAVEKVKRKSERLRIFERLRAEMKECTRPEKK